MLDVCCALWYLHALTPVVVHGDLKPENVMMEPKDPRAAPWNSRAKLLDFGLSRVLSRRNSRRLGGSLVWMAPEVIWATPMRPESSAEVFSFGRLMYFVCTGRVPFQDQSASEIKDAAKRRSPQLLWPSQAYPEQCRPLSDRCMAYAPDSRPTMANIHKELLEWPILEQACQKLEGIRTAEILGTPPAVCVDAVPAPAASDGDHLQLWPSQQLTLRLQGGPHPWAVLQLQSRRNMQLIFQVSPVGQWSCEICPATGTLSPHGLESVAIVLKPADNLELGTKALLVYAEGSEDAHDVRPQSWMLEVVVEEHANLDQPAAVQQETRQQQRQLQLQL